MMTIAVELDNIVVNTTLTDVSTGSNIRPFGNVQWPHMIVEVLALGRVLGHVVDWGARGWVCRGPSSATMPPLNNEQTFDTAEDAARVLVGRCLPEYVGSARSAARRGV